MLGLCNSLNKVTEGYPQYRTKTSCTFNPSAAESITVAHSGSSDYDINASDMSISGWIKITQDASSTDNLQGYAFIKAGTFNTNGWYMFYHDGAGDYQKFQFYTNQDGANRPLTSDSNIVHGTWYHLAITYDVSETTGTIYINGEKDNDSDSQTAPVSFTGDIEMGASDVNEIGAIMSEIVYWKGVVLSASQVAGLYNNGRPRHGLSCERSYIKSWWKLNADDDTGSNNVLDSSGNSRHGTTAAGMASGDFDTTDVPS
tara:strand:+ start:168 stop:941 length:774 start_codon:yes stop_codon:yes gene_type:complete